MIKMEMHSEVAITSVLCAVIMTIKSHIMSLIIHNVHSDTHKDVKRPLHFVAFKKT